MRILQVIPVFSPTFGGPVTVVHLISKNLAKRHEVMVYTTTALDSKHDFEPKEEEVDGYRIHYFSRTLKPLCYSYLFGQLNISWDMMEAIKYNIRKFDVVHLHSWRQFPDVIVHHYASKYNVPYVIQAHGSVPRVGKEFRKLLYDFTFGYRVLYKASKVIALSRVEAEQYRRMGVPEEKIAIIPNGIDLSEYANLPPKGAFKKKFGIPKDKKVILYLGRIHRIKGIDLLIKAYAYLIEKMGNKDAVLVMAGPDDGYLNEAKALADSLRVSDSVMFVGPLYGVDKLAAYVDSDLCVLPSRYETFPMVLLEAYACGKPIVASNVGGLKELIMDGETGLLFEAGNFKQMAEKMIYLLNNVGRAVELGRKAKKLVEEKYSIDKVADDLEALYMEVATVKAS